MHRKYLITTISALIILAAVILAAVLPGTRRPGRPEEKPAGLVHIYVHFQDSTRLKAFSEEITSFQGLEPGIEIILHNEPFSSIDTGFRNGTLDPAPDILVTSAPTSYEAGAFLSPPAPWIVRAWTLYYNRKALATIGVDPDGGTDPLSRGLAAGSLTENEWETLLANLSGAGIIPITLGARYTWPLTAWIQHLTAFYGTPEDAASLVAADTSKPPKSYRQAFEAFAEYLERGWVWEGYAEADWPSALRPLIDGKAAFCLLSDSLSSSIPPDYRQDIGFLPFPRRGEDQEDPWLIGSVVFLGINAETGAPGASGKVLEFLTSPGTTGRLSKRLLMPLLSSEDDSLYLLIPGMGSGTKNSVTREIEDTLR